MDIEQVKRAYNRIVDLLTTDNHRVRHVEELDIIGKAITELQQIKEANHSYAIEKVNHILSLFDGEEVQIETMTLSKCNILSIKQALIKTQLFEKAYEDVKALPLESLIETYKQDIVLDIFTKEIKQLEKEKAEYKQQVEQYKQSFKILLDQLAKKNWLPKLFTPEELEALTIDEQAAMENKELVESINDAIEKMNSTEIDTRGTKENPYLCFVNEYQYELFKPLFNEEDMRCSHCGWQKLVLLPKSNIEKTTIISSDIWSKSVSGKIEKKENNRNE